MSVSRREAVVYGERERRKEQRKAQNQKDERQRSRHGLSSDGRARVEACKNGGENGPQLPAFDEARRGGIYMQY